MSPRTRRRHLRMARLWFVLSHNGRRLWPQRFMYLWLFRAAGMPHNLSGPAR